MRKKAQLHVGTHFDTKFTLGFPISKLLHDLKLFSRFLLRGVGILYHY